MKARQEYLEMTPPHIRKERWIKMVNQVFDKPDFDENPMGWRKFLDDLFISRPRSIQDRWAADAKMYKEAAKNKEQ